MRDIGLGKHGAVLLAVLFVVLLAEDALIWLRSGAVPGVEFFAGTLAVLAVTAVAVYEANRHPPVRR
ncbi:hypothetical protein [Halopelagius longus]|uniref:Uncharacterized protein n=1 Tax=Halopelagius longus TaxID=1236180 RepID=A0A1H1B1R0_9EURY|nr:hypothetical protein [Halopelagius longus]RDI70606.1 hypothetical protein DWB78_02070 [Halopelagius longus]SDQ45840.1 hypothetical protein SAMN05216278_1594 [Halopelagius longus]